LIKKRKYLLGVGTLAPLDRGLRHLNVDERGVIHEVGTLAPLDRGLRRFWDGLSHLLK